MVAQHLIPDAEAYRRFEMFTRLANKGSLHANDLDRLADFICIQHRADPAFDIDPVLTQLQQDPSWQPHTLDRIRRYVEIGFDILDANARV